ncbi:MAG: phosphoribosyl-ATP diphosphatase [Phycisphaerales bacterium]
MIVPSIDIMDGRAVQLIGGKEKAIDAGDPRPLARRFGRVGEVAVIDLDAAMGRGSNAAIIEELLGLAPCRVGGGIRDVQTARRWLDRGARRVILGTAARPEVLAELPRERVIAALDGVDGRVVVEGWQAETGSTVDERIDALCDLVGGFLVTFVEIEGRMTGLPRERVEQLVQRCGDARLTVAGGVKDAADVAMADAAGADAQVGMSLYSGAMDLADGFAAPLRSDRADGLWPTVVCDTRGVALGLVYSNRQSLHAAIEEGAGVYYSRSRGGLWRKGETSGHIQRLIRIDADCDRDALRFVVEQQGSGFCHTGSATCFGGVSGLAALDRTLETRVQEAPAGSYTRRLLDDAELLRSKLLEEAGELAEAEAPDDVAWEAADVVYFALVAARRHGVGLADIEKQLDQRARRVSRRGGEAKT